MYAICFNYAFSSVPITATYCFAILFQILLLHLKERNSESLFLLIERLTILNPKAIKTVKKKKKQSKNTPCSKKKDY